MSARELILLYFHSSTPTVQTRILAQPISLAVLAKYSGLFHDRKTASRRERYMIDPNVRQVETYTLRGPSLSAYRTILNWMLRSAAQAKELSLTSDGLEPLATLNFRSKSYTALAQLRLSAKILRVPYLEIMLLSRMKQFVKEKPLLTHTDLRYLLTCGDFMTDSTPVMLMVRGLVDRYLLAEKAGRDYHRSEVWALVRSQDNEFVELVEKEIRKRRATEPLDMFSVSEENNITADSDLLKFRGAISASARSCRDSGSSRSGGKLSDLPTEISPWSSCSCICTCEDSQLFFTGPRALSSSSYQCSGSCCSTCCPIQGANIAFFRSFEDEKKHFHPNAGKNPADTTAGVGFNDALLEPQLSPKKPIHDQKQRVPHPSYRTSKKRPVPVDKSLARFSSPLMPVHTVPEPALNVPLIRKPESPTRNIDFVVPSTSLINPGVVVRKAYDDEGKERLEMVRPKFKEKQESGRLEQELRKQLCCCMM